MNMRKNLAVAMIVKNEEFNLPKCVKSFRKHGLNPDFYLTDRLVNEVPLEMLMMSFWNAGKKKESLMYYMRLQEVNPENYLVKENRSWFETYKFMLN